MNRWYIDSHYNKPRRLGKTQQAHAGNSSYPFFVGKTKVESFLNVNNIEIFSQIYKEIAVAIVF